MQKLLIALIIGCNIFPASPVAATELDTTPKGLCTDRINRELTREHDIYRSHIFGSTAGSDGKFYSKTGGETDGERKGILERPKRLTSELIDALVESYRAYRCKSMAVCRTAAMSFGDNASDPKQIKILGCTDVETELYPECHLAEMGDNDSAARVSAECMQTLEDTLAFERSVLMLAAAYDSGYRSLMQFAGMADWLIKDLPTRGYMPLRSMVNLLGRLYRIPCFTGQCDMPDNSDLDPPSP